MPKSILRKPVILIPLDGNWASWLTALRYPVGLIKGINPSITKTKTTLASAELILKVLSLLSTFTDKNKVTLFVRVGQKNT